MKNKKHPIQCKSKPKHCECDPKNWSGWYEICPRHVGDDDSFCLRCNHSLACHTNAKTKNVVAKTLIDLHNGDSISDEALNETIAKLEEIQIIFEGINIKSMPEYEVFSKALRKDLIQLEGFVFARENH